jgi:hydrogenase nickel incorporation protein HypA/HybF
MHEFSIAQQIVEVVLRTAREQQAREVERVELVIGELALLNGEQVRFWVEEMFSRQPLTGSARLEMEIRPGRVRCPGCGFEGDPPAPGPEAHFLSPALICPQCGRAGLEIREGRECLVRRITVTREDGGR